MKFRTEISVLPAEFSITHSDKIEMMGSCFVENLSARMLGAGFVVEVNPFGIVYNPVSIANGLRNLIDNTVYTEANLFFHEDVYHSFSHHSRFSGSDKPFVLEQINAQINRSSSFLREATVLIITFGTASVYRLLSSGEIVSNCHKLPAKLFREERLSISQITDDWNELILSLKKINSDLKVLFTVSPIRHWKNGAYENQLNKATLLLAIDELTKRNGNCYYFPSYEIMMDDLRDYRFYAEDLIHPNVQAIDYLWEKFGDAYFNKKTLELIKAHEREQKALNHRIIIK